MYPYDIKQAKAEPHGAPDIELIGFFPPVFIIGLLGKNGAKCFATQIGPTPGPHLRGELQRFCVNLDDKHRLRL